MKTKIMDQTTSHQKFRDYVEALRIWELFGRKGTRPRKVRHNSAKHKHKSRALRVLQNRAKTRITKTMQRNRLSKVRDVRHG